LQACVNEPLKPFLDRVIVSATMHVSVLHTNRGELVLGAEIDPYTSYSYRSTLPFLQSTASHLLALFP
ncbi:MAG: sarcosine oxidase subunit beta, partial [Chloroflexota bacterium]